MEQQQEEEGTMNAGRGDDEERLFAIQGHSDAFYAGGWPTGARC